MRVELSRGAEAPLLHRITLKATPTNVHEMDYPACVAEPTVGALKRPSSMQVWTILSSTLPIVSALWVGNSSNVIGSLAHDCT